jgi:hypothetical protein
MKMGNYAMPVTQKASQIKARKNIGTINQTEDRTAFYIGMAIILFIIAVLVIILGIVVLSPNKSYSASPKIQTGTGSEARMVSL